MGRLCPLKEWVALQQKTFPITGLHCNACVAKVERALAPLAQRVSVSLADHTVTFENLQATATLATVNTILAAVGNYRLNEASEKPASADMSVPSEKSWLETYYPLLLIVGYIAVASLAGGWRDGFFDWHGWMNSFMAGFFLVFSFFKFLDLRGFASAYAGYDLLAARWHGYGYVYPFLELALGLAFLFGVMPAATLLATVALMGFSSIGVMRAVLRKQKIRCACLGTALNLPMSTVTIIEDLGMAAMALVMLLGVI
jgi:copper chaperone CopZ